MIKRCVKFSALWCGPCKAFSPIFDKVSEEYKDRLEFHKIDVDGATGEDAELMQKLRIMSIPTTVFLDENNVVDKKIIGSISEQEFKNIIDEELNKE